MAAKKHRPTRSEPRENLVIHWAVPLVVAFVTFAVFSQALHYGFVDWDDDRILLENARYRGLNWVNLQWMFTTFYKSLYRPLTWVSFGFDYLMWGMNPLGYHLSNLLLHTVNALLVHRVALLLYSLPALGLSFQGDASGNIFAGIAALLFSIHPLRVEPVAWVSARNDLLSAFFVLISIVCYLKHAQAVAQSPGLRQWVGLAAVMYLLAMLSKASHFAMPLVLLVLDVYPLGRWRTLSVDGFAPAARKLVWEKIPLFLVAIAGAGIAFAAKQSEAMVGLEEYGLGQRVAQSTYGVIFYVWKTVIPLGLSPLYSLSAQSTGSVRFIFIGTLGIAALTLGIFYLRKRWPAVLAAWVCYVLLIAPVLGLVQSGPQSVADRYSYLSCLGWALLIGAYLFHIWRIRQNKTASSALTLALWGVPAVIIVVWGLLSWNQVRIWRNSETLWRRVVAIEPASSIGHNSLGAALLKQGSWPAAERHLREALRLSPTHSRAHNNLANLLSLQGRLNDAIEHYKQALMLDPDYAKAHYNLAIALSRQGDGTGAIEHFRRAIAIDGSYVRAHFHLGLAYAARQEYAFAAEQFRQTVRLQPEFGEAHVNLGRALAALGERGQAVKHYEDGLRILKSRSNTTLGRDVDTQ